MNQPSLLALPFVVLLCVVFLNSLGCGGCTDEVNDDTSKPADGETGVNGDTGKAETGAPASPPPGAAPGDPDPTCEAALETCTADLAECKAPK